MQKRVIILPLLLAVMLQYSCGEGAGRITVPDNFDASEIMAQQNSMENILTREMVSRVVDISVGDIQEHREKSITRDGQYTVLYSWPTGHFKTLGGKHQIEVYYSIGVGFVKNMKAAEFEKFYESNAGLQQQMDDIPHQENFNKEVGMVEARYISEYAQRRKIERLNNVGTIAYWEKSMAALHILVNDVALTITTNFGDNDQLARKYALAVVAEIMKNDILTFKE